MKLIILVYVNYSGTYSILYALLLFLQKKKKNAFQTVFTLLQSLRRVRSMTPSTQAPLQGEKEL